MSERPFMQFYPSDFIGDTMHLTPEQMGAYIRLLCSMWNAGGKLQDDDRKLATISGFSMKKWRAVGDDIRAFFVLENGVLTHNRMTKEIQKVDRKSDLRRSAGAKGGKANALKYNKQGEAKACDLLKHLPEPYGKGEEPLPPEPYKTKKTKAKKTAPNGAIAGGDGLTKEFLDFWEKWKSVNGGGARQPAFKAWQKLKPDERKQAAESSVGYFAAWRSECPDASALHGATYLNQKRWQDYGQSNGASWIAAMRAEPTAEDARKRDEEIMNRLRAKETGTLQ